MDQDIFRETYRDVNQRSCLFEKSVLINQCECSQAERFCIAEREGVRCRSQEGHDICALTLDILREQARFSLRTNDDRAILPHGKAMRIQVGGMRGIRNQLEPTAEHPEAVPDVYGILRQTIEKYGSLEALPFDNIVRFIAAYKSKKRSHRSDK